MGTADKEELLKIFDEDGKSLGFEVRSRVHDEQLFHQEVAIWIINSEGQLLLEKRSIQKKANPGRLSLCAGHIVGEDTVEDTIVREAQEEIGFDISCLDYKYVTMVKRKERNNYCFSHHYILFADVDLSSLTIQQEELSEVIFMDYREFKSRVMHGDQSVALPWTEAYQTVFNCVDKLLEEHFAE